MTQPTPRHLHLQTRGPKIRIEYIDGEHRPHWVTTLEPHQLRAFADHLNDDIIPALHNAADHTTGAPTP